LYFPVDGLVFSPNGEDGNKKRGRPGAYGRSVLKTVNADTEPKIISLLLPSSIETLMPASLDAAGLDGRQSIEISVGTVCPRNSGFCSIGDEE
jgi:hypothetical protein